MVLVQQTVVQMKSTWAFSYDSLILNWTFFSRRISSVKYWKKEFYKPNNLSLLLFWNWPSLNIQTCTVVITDHFQFFHFTEFISTNWTLILYLQKKLKFTTEFNGVFGRTRKEEFGAKFMCAQLQRSMAGVKKYTEKDK